MNMKWMHLVHITNNINGYFTSSYFLRIMNPWVEFYTNGWMCQQTGVVRNIQKYMSDAILLFLYYSLNTFEVSFIYIYIYI